MELSKQELNKLKHLIPDFAAQLEDEKKSRIDKAIARIDNHHYSFSRSLMDAMKSYDDLVLNGYKPCHAEHRLIGSGFNFSYLKPDNVIDAEKDKITKEIDAEFKEKVTQLQNDFLEKLVGDELKKRENVRLDEIKFEQEKLKEKLLSQLFD